MTTIQVCAMIALIILVGLTYWAGYRGGLIDGRIVGVEDGKTIQQADHAEKVRALECSLNNARVAHQQLLTRYKQALAATKLDGTAHQTLLDIAEKLRIAAETFSAFRTGKKLERDSIVLRERALAMAALLQPAHESASNVTPHGVK